MKDEKLFDPEKINYEKLQKTIEDNCYSLSGLARKIHKPVYKLKRAVTKEGKHNYLNDLFIYVDLAILFETGLRELIY